MYVASQNSILVFMVFWSFKTMATVNLVQNRLLRPGRGFKNLLEICQYRSRDQNAAIFYGEL